MVISEVGIEALSLRQYIHYVYVYVYVTYLSLSYRPTLDFYVR